jgi:PKD repeat protein
MKNVMLFLIALILITAGFAGSTHAADIYPVRGTFNWEHQDWYLAHVARGALYPLVYYNNSASSAWVNTSDGLHLKARYVNTSNTWECAEAQSQYDYLYGTYTFVVTTPPGGVRLDELDNKTVVGIYLYENDTHEIDFELLQHTAPADSGKELWYTNQPYTTEGNIIGYPLTLTGTSLTTQFTWSPDCITWSTWQADGTLISTHNYTNVSGIPRGPMNLKLMLSTKGNTSDMHDIEIIISNMTISGNSTIYAPVYNGANTYTNIYTHQVSPEINCAYISTLNSTLSPVQTLSPYAKYNTTGLRLWYRLDEPTHTAAYITDSSGNMYNGELSHLKWQLSGNPTASAFKYNSGMSFDGVNDYIIVPSNMTMIGNMTYCAYINTTNTTKTEAVLIEQNTGNNNKSYEFNLNGTHPECRLGDGSYHADAIKMFDMIYVSADTPTYIVYTIAGNNATVYANNGTGWKSQSKTMPVSLNTILSTPDFRIGGLSSNYHYTMYQGSMDNIMIWNRTLGASEIYGMYNDTTNDILAKTNSNAVSGSISAIPYNNTDDNISSIVFSAPSYTTIGGVVVYDYTKSLSAFNATIGYANTPAIAIMGASKTHGDAPLVVQFTDSSLYSTSRVWDFGDGTNSTEQNPTHTYTEVGRYTVTLTSTGPYGTDVSTTIVRASNIESASDTWITATGLMGIIVLFIFISLAIGAIQGKIEMSTLVNATIGLMILMLVVMLGTGVLSKLSEVF